MKQLVQAQFEQLSGAHDLVHTIMLTSSACKQHSDREKALKLVSLVNEFAAAFCETKGVSAYTAMCPYPPKLNVLYPKLV